ncbi:MAG TPA: bifunctional DNA-formamidopyrimidine glycosylase/DNA-(apurinic or apyrimidinic site) lyase, partial [Planctomycetota bacterium]
PFLRGRKLDGAVVRQSRLRWPVPADLDSLVCGRRVRAVGRRGKYLLIELAEGSLILHLGMSGSLRVLPSATPPGRHDHLDLLLAGGRCLRLHDPRRFGSVLWQAGPAAAHPLLAALGPEPLEPGFDGGHLHDLAHGRRVAVKPFLMDAKIVVGVGNIYANEALHRAGIHPGRAAGRISAARYALLAAAVRKVLAEAIATGGTTLRDYTGSDGEPGWFRLQLQVYGREGAACRTCATPLRAARLGQRATVWCPRCQR